MGILGGLLGLSSGIAGILFKIRRYMQKNEMRQQSLLGAKIHEHVHFDISGFNTEEGQTYIGIINKLLGSLSSLDLLSYYY